MPSLPSTAPASPGTRQAAAFAALLALCFTALFPTIVFGSATFFYRDYGVLAYPTIFYQHDCFWKGELPLWNPYSNCGAPFLAQWGTMVLYPFSLFYLVLPLPWSLNIFCLAHLIWAGVGMFCLARRWTGSSLAAGVAGMTFVFNGVTLSSLMWPNYCVALGWMPWVVLTVDRTWTEPNRRKLVLAIFAASLQLLAGVPEVVLLTWVVLGGIGALHFFSGQVSRTKLAAASVLLLILVSGLVAVQLLPFLDLLAHSQRGVHSATSKWTMPLWAWGDFVLPMFRCAESPQGMFFQLGQEFFASNYLGVLTLALGLSGIWLVRDRRVWLLAGLSLLCLVFALGDDGVLYRAVRQALPALGLVRYPVKFLILPAFALPVLAGYGMRAILGVGISARIPGGRSLFTVAGAILLAIGGLLYVTRFAPSPYDQWPVVWQSAAWRLFFLGAGLAVLILLHRKRRDEVSSRILTGVLLALLVADSLIAVPSKNPVLPASVLAPGIWELQNKVPPPALGSGRVMISPVAEEHLLISRVRDLQSDFIGKRLALWSHLNLLDKAPKVNGSSTLQLLEEKEIESALYASTNMVLPQLNRFLGVTFVTAPGQIIEWVRCPDALPLITAGQAPIFAGPAETLRALTNSAFNPATTVYLPPEAKEVGHASAVGKAKILSSHFGAHEIRCETRATEPSIVVIAQSFYSKWHAWVDGRPVRLWRANYAFQALEIPAGDHHVRVAYVDTYLHIGALLSAAAMLGCLFLWFSRPGKGVSP